MTPEQIIERARLVRVFLESAEFKAAWEGAEDDLVSEFRNAQTPEQAVRVHEELRAMSRVMAKWRSHLANATIAEKEREDRERKRGFFR